MPESRARRAEAKCMFLTTSQVRSNKASANPAGALSWDGPSILSQIGVRSWPFISPRQSAIGWGHPREEGPLWARWLFTAEG